MNEVSIIINGVRYDAVEATKKELNDFCFLVCDHCDLGEYCKKYEPFEVCGDLLGRYKYFKKRKDKSWIKLERDKDGFYDGDVFDLYEYTPFIIREKTDFGDWYDEQFSFVDKDVFSDWAGDIDRHPKYTHILPNVPLINE